VLFRSDAVDIIKVNVPARFWEGARATLKRLAKVGVTA
jgi:hypothetical protein